MLSLSFFCRHVLHSAQSAICAKGKDVRKTCNNQILHSNVFKVLRRTCMPFSIQGIFSLRFKQSTEYGGGVTALFFFFFLMWPISVRLRPSIWGFSPHLLFDMWVMLPNFNYPEICWQNGNIWEKAQAHTTQKCFYSMN